MKSLKHLFAMAFVFSNLLVLPAFSTDKKEETTAEVVVNADEEQGTVAETQVDIANDVGAGASGDR